MNFSGNRGRRFKNTVKLGKQKMTAVGPPEKGDGRNRITRVTKNGLSGIEKEERT